MSVASGLMSRGQHAWLTFGGAPTVRADAPSGTVPVRAVLLIPDAAGRLFQGLEYDSTRTHLVCARGALGELDPETVVVVGGERVQVQGGGIAVPPDGELVAYPVLRGSR